MGIAGLNRVARRAVTSLVIALSYSGAAARCEPGAIQAKTTTPAAADLVVYLEGATVICKDVDGQVVASGANPATVIQAAIDSIPSGKILVKNGTFPIPKGSQITLKGGIELIGENESGTQLVWADPAATDTTFQNIVNANVTTGDKFIKIANMTLNFGTPQMTSGGFINNQGYNWGIYFQGVHDSVLERLTLVGASFRFDPKTGASRSDKLSFTGLNYGNLVERVTSKNGVASAALFAAHTTRVNNCRFLNWADDSILLAESGLDVQISECYFDGQESWPFQGGGGKTAEIYILNDGAVDGKTCDVFDVTIRDCWIRNPPPSTTTLGACITAARANVRILNTTVEGAVGYISAFGNKPGVGGNIVLRNCQFLMDNVISKNSKDNGAYIYFDSPIAKRRSAIVRSKFFNNAQGGAKSVFKAGIRFESTQSSPLLDLVECEFFDDQAAPTQVSGVSTLSTGNARNLNVIRCAFGHGLTKKVDIHGSIVDAFGIVRENFGLNPIGVKDLLGAPAITGAPFVLGVSAGLQPAPLVAGQDYTVYAVDCSVTSSGGTGVSITVKDDAANTVISNLATLDNFLLKPGWTINFGAFSVAPTVRVWCD